MKIIIDGTHGLYDYKVILSDDDTIRTNWIDVSIERGGSSVVDFAVPVEDLYRASKMFEEIRLEDLGDR